jgi:8-oxo-(d)GTP phosphatase
MRARASVPVRAAGGVLWRVTPAAGLEIALIHRPKYDDWSLPKGKLARGEHVLTAAVREVEEETGVPVRLGRPLPSQHYLVDGRPKEVQYWAAHPRQNSHPPFSPTDEVDEFVWLPVGEAQRQLSRARDSDILASFTAAPISTTPLLLLRHAAAVNRSDWAGADPVRPLSDAGAEDALALTHLLSAFGVERLISSNTLRCTDTVQPYAEQEGLPLEEEMLFSEDGYKQHRDESLARAPQLLTIDRPTVVCSHRPVLPDVMVRLCRRSGVQPPAHGLHPGAFWVLHLADGRVVAVEEHQPTGGSAPRVLPENRTG